MSSLTRLFGASTAILLLTASAADAASMRSSSAFEEDYAFFEAQEASRRSGGAEAVVANKNEARALSAQGSEYRTAEARMEASAVHPGMGTGQITHRADGTVETIFFPDAGAEDVKLVQYAYFPGGAIESVRQSNDSFRNERVEEDKYVIDARSNRVLDTAAVSGRAGLRFLRYSYQYSSATHRNFSARLESGGGGEVIRGYELLDGLGRVVERASNERSDPAAAYDPMRRVIVTTSFAETGHTERVYTSRFVNGAEITATDVRQRGLPPSQRRTYVKSGNTPLLKETQSYTFNSAGNQITETRVEAMSYRNAALFQSGAQSSEYVANRLLSYTAQGQVRRTEAVFDDERTVHSYTYTSAGRIATDTKAFTGTYGRSTVVDIYGADSRGRRAVVRQTVDSFPFGGQYAYNTTYQYVSETRRAFESRLEGGDQVRFGYDAFDSQGRIVEHVENTRSGTAAADPMQETISRYSYDGDRVIETQYSSRSINGVWRSARSVLTSGLSPAQRVQWIARGDVRLERERRIYQFAENGTTIRFTFIQSYRTVSS